MYREVGVEVKSLKGKLFYCEEGKIWEIILGEGIFVVIEEVSRNDLLSFLKNMFFICYVLILIYVKGGGKWYLIIFFIKVNGEFFIKFKGRIWRDEFIWLFYEVF